MSSIIQEVETFIQRLHDMDYIITTEATKLWYTFPSHEPLSTYPTREKRRNLSDCLANAISDYQEKKDNEQRRLKCAERCSIWINRAFASGVIQEGKGLISKNKELERDVKRLQELFDECNKKCQTLEQENKKLHKLFRDNRFTGEVQSE